MQHHPLMQPGLVLGPPAEWRRILDGDPAGLALFERHYSCRADRSPTQKQFVGPGWSIVLLTNDEQSLFVWWKQKYRKDGQQGINCAVFRKESPGLASEMLLAAERWAWDRWPGQRLFTFVDPQKVASANPGYCFKKAGWQPCGTTRKGLLILEKYPPPTPPIT